MVVCNPPFHASAKEAEESNLRKVGNLAKRHVKETNLNFGGQQMELWYKGGERRFTQTMISESGKFARNCLWFTTLVSRKDNLTSVYFELDKANVAEIKTIPMGQGNKISRVVAWSFKNKLEREDWGKQFWE